VSEHLFDAIENAARIARLERRQQRERDLRGEVAECLAANPDASANAVLLMVGGRRSDVLRLVRELRNSSSPVPSDREPPKEGSC
jgi:hypothetical protein